MCATEKEATKRNGKEEDNSGQWQNKKEDRC